MRRSVEGAMTHEDWYPRAHEALSRLTTGLQRREPLNLEEVSRLAHALTDSLQEGDHLVIHALSGPAGSPLITNLLNVGILTTKIGSGLGYYGADLHRLAMAALVHDIGIFSIPDNILRKTGPLTSEERILIEEHPRLGFESILQSGESHRWLAEVVLQAHERWMGQGYPNKLKGRQINELAQIIGLVDVFDALVSPRPYRRRLLPHEAVRELLSTERTAFPREVMKALVEQLSVYPLGTKLRVNTGEEGIVIGINPQYPCRPLIIIEQGVEGGSTVSKRTLDLSAMPFVWVTEAIAPPDIDRMAPGASAAGRGPENQPVRSSDQFAALLESLDAIADVIQTAVDTRGLSASAPISDESNDPSEADTQAMEETIAKELLGLFALEAREWIRQIHVALMALDHTAEKARQSELLKIMLDGMSNLAKSAATVPLPAIEHLALDLIPLLDSAGQQHRTTAGHHLQILQDGLARLASAIRELPCETKDGALNEPVDTIRTRATCENNSVRDDEQAEPGRIGSPVPILDALRQLRQARGRSMQPMRDILEEVIHRAEQMAPETSPIDAQGIGRILSHLDALDGRFMDHMTERVPVLVDTIAQLKEKQDNVPLFSEALASILRDIDELHESAEQVHATAITLFLQGLHTFLTVAAHSKRSGVYHRLQAVQVRLAVLVPLAKQWVDIGRIERTAIIDILPL
jgi:hypothetical protein